MTNAEADNHEDFTAHAATSVISCFSSMWIHTIQSN